ncbi:hypothetical protein HKBW3S06_01214 [Candidatus Hakubella thermalkaliphila]|uniref:DUF72 domain-containing protein n=1 Tax=Candidatus Hakubella thermalkaliphila TaxID=2754717 RepID=A0A6V8NNV1_9ACTN|nr:DUF72 domain-containing protein [Candidatus Hakubella thermalkaliphila]GFP21988.1 hypothetical protein HKBW3S06_01214 [Candidatus Hakubella thermalkaliphila]
MAQVRIGTSGWSYKHWQYGVFYPEGLQTRGQLPFYAQSYDTVEINNSFYHLPAKNTFEDWKSKVPKGFLFAVKASRYITHIKRLKDAEEAWKKFLANTRALEEKLGPILFQLSPNFAKNLSRLEDFIEILPSNLRYSFEFRHPTWLDEEVYEVLKKKNIALCIPDSPGFPTAQVITANFTYLRFHGGQILYGSDYSEEELGKWAKKISGWLKQDIDVYAYFNNDAYGYALKNAWQLRGLVDIYLKEEGKCFTSGWIQT